MTSQLSPSSCAWISDLQSLYTTFRASHLRRRSSPLQLPNGLEGASESVNKEPTSILEDMFPSSKTIIPRIFAVSSLSLQTPDDELIFSLRAHLSWIWREGTGADFRLVIESDHSDHSKTVTIPCHSVILIARSGYFQKRLTSCEFNKKQGKEMETSLQLEHLPFDRSSLFFALEYMYTGAFNVVVRKNPTLLSGVYRAAVFLSIPALQAEVESYIASEIHPGPSRQPGDTLARSTVDLDAEMEHAITSCLCKECEIHIRGVLEFIIENGIHNRKNMATGRAFALHLGSGWRWCSSLISKLALYAHESSNGADACADPATICSHLCLAESALQEIDRDHHDSVLHTIVKKMVLQARDNIDAKICNSARKWIASSFWEDAIEEARMNGGDALDSCKWILSSFIRGFTNLAGSSYSDKEILIVIHNSLSEIAIKSLHSESDEIPSGPSEVFSLMTATLFDIEAIMETDFFFVAIGKDWIPLRCQGGLWAGMKTLQLVERHSRDSSPQIRNSAYHIDGRSKDVRIVSQPFHLGPVGTGKDLLPLSEAGISYTSLPSTISTMTTHSSLDLVYMSNYNEAAANLAARDSTLSLIPSGSIMTYDTRTSTTDSDYGIDFRHRGSFETIPYYSQHRRTLGLALTS